MGVAETVFAIQGVQQTGVVCVCVFSEIDACLSFALSVSLWKPLNAS